MADLDEIEREVKALFGERERLEHHIELVKAKTDGVKAEVDGLKVENARLRESLSLYEERERLKHQIELEKAEGDRLERELAERKEALRVLREEVGPVIAWAGCFLGRIDYSLRRLGRWFRSRLFGM